MFSNKRQIGIMSFRGPTLGVLIVMAILAITLFTSNQLLAQTPQPDTNAPMVTPPLNITVEAAGPSGTQATNASIAAFLEGATALDDVDGPVTVTNDAPPVFPLGPTTVTFSATDSAQNTDAAQATVTVVDTTAPVVTSPFSITVEAAGPSGTPATSASIAAFLSSASALDAVDGAVVVANDAPPVFPLGSTPVTFTATDSASNTDAAQATVTVVDNSLPGPPAAFMATASHQRVDLDWADNGEEDLEGYDVYRSTTSGGPYTKIVSLLLASGYTDIPLTNGITYYYVVVAVDVNSNQSLRSVEASATPPDLIPPTIAGSADPPPNVNGWNNTNVAVTFECADTESGIANCEGSRTLTKERFGLRVEGTATDVAGNTASAAVGSINIDKSAPTVTITSPAGNAVFRLLEPVIAVWAASDGLSGIDSSNGTIQSGLPIDTSIQGLSSFTVTATDNAGNAAGVTHSFTVLTEFASFDIEAGRLVLEQGAATDEFEAQGSFVGAGTSNGIDVANEEVTVTLDGFTQTIPAGSFFPDGDDGRFEFIGASDGISQASIEDDGRFLVQAKGVDLGSIVTGDPVLFSIRIGDDVGQATIPFGVDPFRLEIRQARDLFGTVVLVTVLPEDQGVLVINTKDGIVDVLTDADTKFTLPRKRHVRIDDLVEGDLVAVSLEEKDGVLVANKVFLVSGKTQYRHVPGVIVDFIAGEQITIQPPGASAEQVTFNITDRTKIKRRGGVDGLIEGLFVVVSAVRDPLTGNILADALEIIVTSGKPKIKQPEIGSLGAAAAEGDDGDNDDGATGDNDDGATGDVDDGDDGDNDDGATGDIDDGDDGDNDDGATGDNDDGDDGNIDDGDVGEPNKAEVRGVFEGVDDDGNLIVNGATVFLDPDTEIEGGLVVGQVVEIEGILQEDGTILALEVESKDDDAVVSNKIALKGIFQGIDPVTRDWIISGNLVAVGPGTDTDGLPSEGQLVIVDALLQEDGTLLAREIENKSGTKDIGEDPREVKISGTFQGVDPDGKWVINGAVVLVDPLTRLKGTPAVGEQIEVKALLQEDGSLLAQKIKAGGRDTSRSSNKAEIRGTVDDILDDGTLVVDGVAISLSILTDLEIDPKIGDSVKVEAFLQADGSLTGREVEGVDEPRPEGAPEASKVEIEGTIESLNADGSLVVNGITVVIGPDSEIKGSLVEGAVVKLEGLIQEDGTLLARELKIRGRQATLGGTQREVEGLVEEILRDRDGNILEIVVDGETISAEALTRFEGLLEVGTSVDIEGLEINGHFVALKIEGQKDTGKAQAEEARAEGRAKAKEAREKAEEKAEKVREKAEDKAEQRREKAEERGEIGNRGGTRSGPVRP